MKIVRHLLGDVPQFAVFDTGFHRHMPGVAQTYPGPYEWFEMGIRRHGFHGINHQYCASRAVQLVRKDLKSLRIVSCHLGNGCSVAGIRGGRSVDTTMGFTPLDGLMMGTRSGTENIYMIYAESFKDESHLNVIREAQQIVSNALGQPEH